MTLEQARAEIARTKRRRRRNLAAALCVLAVAIGVGAVAVSRIMPLYGQWEYENRRESHTICKLDGPAFLSIEIHYEGQAPGDLRLTSMDGDRILQEVRSSDDPEEKMLTVTCDVPPENASGACTLSLVTADNYELKYLADVQPSYKYVDGRISFYKDGNGDMWLRAEGEYGRCSSANGMRLNVVLKGSSYAPTLYDGWIPLDPPDRDGNGSQRAAGAITVNLSELALWKRAELGKATSVEAVLQADYVNPYTGDPAIASMKAGALLSEYPEYDPDAGLEFDMAETLDYLRKLNLRVPEGREPLDAPAQEDPGESGEAIGEGG